MTAICFGQLPGELDSAFFAGRTTTKFGDESEIARAVALQTDGKIVVAGYESSGGFPVFAVARYNADGTLDTSFSGDGKATIFLGNSSSAYAVALQADGKIVAAGESFNGTSFDFAVARFNADGSPDANFSGDGMTTVSFGNNHDSAYAMVIQPDGKFTLAGHSFVGATTVFALARFNSDGSPDATFDGDGKLTTSFGNSDTATAITYRSGRLIVAGYTGNVSANDIAVARYNLDGSLDATFDGDGKATAGVGVSQNIGESVAVQPDGKIVVGGWTSFNGNQDFALFRFNSNGALDNTFDGDGKVVTPIGASHDSASTITIQPDGKILAAGTTNIGGNNRNLALARYNANGSLDTAFDTDGKATIPVGGSADGINAVALQTDGKIVVAGDSSNGTNSDFAVARLNANGSLDGTFGNRVKTSFGKDNNGAAAVAVQTDGKIVVAGLSVNAVNNAEFAVARYNADGTLDATFGTLGKVVTPIGNSVSFIHDLKIQTDGKIIVVGNMFNGANQDMALVRFNTNGTLDATFDGDGKLTIPIGSGDDYADSVVIQTDGKIVVGGSSNSGVANFDFTLVRLNSDGTFDNSFDGDGKAIINISGSDFISGIDIQQADGKIVAAGFSTNSGTNIFSLVRFNPNGSLDNSFDGDGKVLTSIGGLNDTIDAMTIIQSSGKIVVAGRSAVNAGADGFNFALARYNPNGTLDNSFDGDGKVTTAVSNLEDAAQTIAVQTNGKIIAAGYSNNGTDKDFAFVSYNDNGSLDSTLFGASGIVTTPIGSGDDRIFDIAIQSNGRIVAVGDTQNGTKSDFAVIRLNGNPIAPTAANVSVGGRILTAKGAGIRNVQVTITFPSGEIRTTASSTFGYYNFGEIPVGAAYVISVSAKKYSFSQPTQIRQVQDELQDIDFISED